MSATPAPFDREAALCRARALAANLERELVDLHSGLAMDDLARLELADLLDGLHWSIEFAIRKDVPHEAARAYYERRIAETDARAVRGRRS